MEKLDPGKYKQGVQHAKSMCMLRKVPYKAVEIVKIICHIDIWLYDPYRKSRVPHLKYGPEIFYTVGPFYRKEYIKPQGGYRYKQAQYQPSS